MKPVTAGERLFLLIRGEVLDTTGSQHAKWASLRTLLDHVGGRPEFGGYVKGAVSVHAMRRLLRFWQAERLLTADEARYVRKVSQFVGEEVFPGLGDELTRRLSRAVIAAEDASFKPIPAGVRSRLLRDQRRVQCYLCSGTLDSQAPKGDAEFLTLEHLWPTSIGGDSVEDNLLPACTRCQHVTKDTASWEWLNVHNLVLPAAPSVNSLRSVQRPVRYARHYFEAMGICEEQGLTLKEAFLRLGAMKPDLTHIKTGFPLTFFDLETR